MGDWERAETSDGGVVLYVGFGMGGSVVVGSIVLLKDFFTSLADSLAVVAASLGRVAGSLAAVTTLLAVVTDSVGRMADSLAVVVALIDSDNWFAEGEQMKERSQRISIQFSTPYSFASLMKLSTETCWLDSGIPLRVIGDEEANRLRIHTMKVKRLEISKDLFSFSKYE